MKDLFMKIKRMSKDDRASRYAQLITKGLKLSLDEELELMLLQKEMESTGEIATPKTKSTLYELSVLAHSANINIEDYKDNGDGTFSGIFSSINRQGFKKRVEVINESNDLNLTRLTKRLIKLLIPKAIVKFPDEEEQKS